MQPLGSTSSKEHTVANPAFTRLDLFPIPVFRWNWPDAHARKPAILAAIRDRQVRDPGVLITNRGGWHSQKDLPVWPDTAIQELVRWCIRCVEASTLLWQDAPPQGPLSPWRVNAWANVNSPGGAHNISHTHANKNWHWSACFYVDLPGISEQEDRGGALILEDRGSGLNLAQAGGVSRLHRILPSEGELIVFPSWLYHRVEPHEGAGDRITIAFNLHNGALEPARLWEHRPAWWWRRFPRIMRRVAKVRGKPDRSPNSVPEGWTIIS